MCGIAGIWSRDGFADKAAISRNLEAAVATIRHRGPDGTGVWTDDVVGLGHARLAVIDLSPSASQPMASGDGTLHVTFNGEIYNYRLVRRDLEAAGYRFRTQSDTEVLLNGYDKWGEDVLARLRGMFAFGLWDSAKRRLFLARDRLGEKPLYYLWQGNRLLFASEIKALLAWEGVPRTPCLEAIHHYLTYQYVPPPLTAFAGIRKLPPGHCMTIGPGGTSEVRRYWRLPPPTDLRRRPTAEVEEELVARLDESVRLCSLSDVPLGGLLSGGVDSASIVAAMARQSDRPVHTFTMGFGEPAFDERPFARLLAERYGTIHHEFELTPPDEGDLRRIVWHYGEPFADSSAVATYQLAEQSRNFVTVALNGDGADESFLGYPRYAAMKLESAIDKFPRHLRRLLATIGNRLPFNEGSPRLLRVARRLLRETGQDPANRYAKWICFFADGQKAEIYGDEMRALLARPSMEYLDGWFIPGAPAAANAAYADLNTYLPGALLTKMDVASMAHGLEVRCPFLDVELVEFATKIDPSLKMRGLRTKALLKSAMADRLPRELIDRPKMGFGVPIEHWLRGSLRGLATDLLTSERSRRRGLFNPGALQRILDGHLSGQRPQHYRIWALMQLELWYRVHIDQPPAAVAPA